MRVRSMVGLLPILGATEVPSWIAERRPRRHLPAALVAAPPAGTGRALAVPFRARAAGGCCSRCWTRTRLRRDPGAAVRLGGVPVLVRHPVAVGGGAGRPSPPRSAGSSVSIEYEPGESRTGMFGGNSNWRGPIWFPVNVLLADKLRTYGRHFGDSFQIEIPTGSGNLLQPRAGGGHHRQRPDGAVPAGRTASGRPTASGSRRPTTRCGASTRRSASTSTGTPARASAPPTRPAGPRWSRTCSTRGCRPIRRRLPSRAGRCLAVADSDWWGAFSVGEVRGPGLCRLGRHRTRRRGWGPGRSRCRWQGGPGSDRADWPAVEYPAADAALGMQVFYLT